MFPHFEKFTIMKQTESIASDSTGNNAVLYAVAPTQKRKCYNCKYASPAFKIAGKTHHQCNHPKHKAGFEDGTLSPWDTLQEFYNTCESHEFRSA